MKRVLLLEDNDNSRKVLINVIRSISDVIKVYDFSDLTGIYDLIFKINIDLFVIDIIIDKDIVGDMSGMKFAEKIRSIPCYEYTPIIFITSLYDPKLYAYSQLHSYSYIEKPFDIENVKNIISDALRFPECIQSDKKLYFRMDGLFYIVKCSEILYIESLRHKVYVHRIDNKEIVVPYRTCEQILSEAEGSYLERCNRGIIVNLNYIEFIDWANNNIKLKGVDNTIRIGLTYKKNLKRIYNVL